MSALTYKGYTARIELDVEDMLLVGRLAGIDDIITFHATSMDELAEVFRESVDDYIETCAKIGKKPEKAYSGKLMLRVDPALHAELAVAADQAGLSLNQYSSDILNRAVAAKTASRTLALLGGSDPMATAAPRR